ncbi:MAG: 3D domain-containing protein [Polyangia bacterium]|nr:3D domain-containing protein [Polyangia bacterium]
MALPLWSDPRPGTWDTPLGVGALPFEHRGHTGLIGERRVTKDVCAPGLPYPGPEVTYEIDVPVSGIVRARLAVEEGLEASMTLVTEDGHCLMRASELLERGLPRGRYRLMVDSRPPEGGYYRLEIWLDPPEPEVLGSLWNTYYYLAQEKDHEGEEADTPLLGPGCEIIAEVPRAFHDDLCIEGSGLLGDGRVVNYASSCTLECYAAVPCGRRSYKICYRELDAGLFPYGMGSQGRVLEPDRSIAVDPALIPLGTILYLPELDGAMPPGRSAPHDGCVRADDVGGAIKGDHIDIYATTRRRWRAWERLHPTRSYFTAILHHPRCYHLPGAPGGGVLESDKPVEHLTAPVEALPHKGLQPAGGAEQEPGRTAHLDGGKALPGLGPAQEGR